MSGIALVLAGRGALVTGSDLKESRYSRALEAAGVPVAIGHRADNLGTPQVVVVSSAIPDTNPEVVEAVRLGIPIWPRARMLAHVAGGRTTLAVAGTHGKTTTSSMMATMLSGMGLDPTFLIGGEVCGFDTNAVNGTGEHYVVEADESDGSFVFLDPHVAIVTNIEADHLDHYGTLARVEETFVEFMSRVAADGALVVWGDSPRVIELAAQADRRVVTYGFAENCDVRCRVIGREGIGTRFEIVVPRWRGRHGRDARPRRPHGAERDCGAGRRLGARARRHRRCRCAFGFLRSAAPVRSGRRGRRSHRCRRLRAPPDRGARDARRRPRTGLQARRRALPAAPLLAHRGPCRASSAMRSQMPTGSCSWTSTAPVKRPFPESAARPSSSAFWAATRVRRSAYLPHRGDVVTFLASRCRPGDLVLTMGAGDVTAVGPELVRELAAPGSSDGPRCRDRGHLPASRVDERRCARE